MSHIVTIAYIIATASGLILIKLGSTAHAIIELTNGKIAFHPTPQNILGLFLYGISFVLYTYLVSKNDLGYIIPITTAFVYIIIFTASFLIFKESFTLPKIIGIAFIFIGLALLNIPGATK